MEYFWQLHKQGAIISFHRIVIDFDIILFLVMYIQIDLSAKAIPCSPKYSYIV